MAFLVELSAVRVRGWMCGGGRVQGGHGVASGGRAMRGQGERRWRQTDRCIYTAMGEGSEGCYRLGMEDNELLFYPLP